jgi:antitoxin MazE
VGGSEKPSLTKKFLCYNIVLTKDWKMRTSITQIGNSKGLIIPAPLLKECGFEGEVSLQVKDNSLIISKVGNPREGWEEAFIKAGADKDLMGTMANDFDESEWTW